MGRRGEVLGMNDKRAYLHFIILSFCILSVFKKKFSGLALYIE